MSDSWFRINLFYFSYFLTKLLSIPHFLFLFPPIFGREVRSKSSCFIPVHATTTNNLCCASRVLFHGNGNLLTHPALLCKLRMVLLMSSQGQEKLWAKWFHDLVHSICVAIHHKWSVESRISHHFIALWLANWKSGSYHFFLSVPVSSHDKKRYPVIVSIWSSCET